MTQEELLQGYYDEIDKIWTANKRELQTYMKKGRVKAALGLVAGRTFEDIESAKSLSKRELSGIMAMARQKIDDLADEYGRKATTLGWEAHALKTAAERIGWQKKLSDDTTKSVYDRLSHIFDTKYGSIADFEKSQRVLWGEKKAVMLEAFRKEVAGEVKDLFDFKDLDKWEKGMQKIIQNNHHGMYIGGRTDFGGTEELSKRSEKWLDKEIKQEGKFLAGFKKDIDKGNLIEVSPASIEARADMYAYKGNGLYQAGKVSAYEEYPGVNIYWRLGLPESHHCQSCPELAAGSPYNESNPLPTYPGNGDTECFTNCYCTLWFEKDGNWEGEII